MSKLIGKLDNFKTNISDAKFTFRGCLKVIFSHIGLLLIVIAYAVIGAILLIDLEIGAEQERYQDKRQAGMDVVSASQYIVSYAWYHSSEDHNEVEFKVLMKRNLYVYQKFIVDKASNNYYDGNIDTWDAQWTFPNALLQAFSTNAAIGYGQPVPMTFWGKIFTVYYAMIGVPLLLLFLANIGELLADAFRYTYSRLVCRLCRIRRKISELKPNKVLKKHPLKKDHVGTESYMPTNEVDVPIVICLTVIAIYIMLGSTLFCYWEGWAFSESCYFTFTTLATIGFGDFVPHTVFTQGNKTFIVFALKIMLCLGYILFGMALLSMCISLMQQQIVIKFSKFAHRVGLIEDDPDPNEFKKFKKSDESMLHITPPSKDGNQHFNPIMNADADDDDDNPKQMILKNDYDKLKNFA